jgi:hypothetical protein
MQTPVSVLEQAYRWLCRQRASSEDLIFSGITSAAARYGSRSERSRITRHGFIGFMSNRKRRRKAPLVWMST